MDRVDIIPAFPDYDGTVGFDRLRDIDTDGELHMVCYEPTYWGSGQRNRLIEQSSALPELDVAAARKTGELMETSGTPAIFTPVLATWDKSEITHKKPTVAFGMFGEPGREKSTKIAWLAYKMNGSVLALDQFYAPITADLYLQWLNEAKPASYSQATVIIFEKLPDWMKAKKTGKQVEAPIPNVQSYREVIEAGFKKWRDNDSNSSWLFVDTVGLPRTIDGYLPKSNRKFNPYDYAVLSCEVSVEAPPRETNGEVWCEGMINFLNGQGLNEAREKRDKLINVLKAAGSN